MSTLIVRDGPMTGRRLTVESEQTVGREDADFIIEDPEVSRRHAVIRPSGDDLEIEDQGSTNGTYVNDNRIEGPTNLAAGDIVRIGNTTLEVQPTSDSSDTVVMQRRGGQTVIAPTDAEPHAPTAAPEGPSSQPQWGPPSQRPDVGDDPSTQEDPPPAPPRRGMGAGGNGSTRSTAKWLLIGGGILAAVLVAFLVYNFFLKAPSKEDFIAQADEICAEGKKDLNKIEAKGPRAEQKARSGALKISQAMLTDLKDLERPDEDGATLDKFFAAYQDFNAAFKKIVQRGNVQRSDQQRLSRAVGRLDKAAKDFGLKECRATPEA